MAATVGERFSLTASIFDTKIRKRVWEEQPSVYEKIIYNLPKKWDTVPPFELEPLLRNIEIRRCHGNIILYKRMRETELEC